MLSGLLKTTITTYFALAKKLKEQENKATTPLPAKQKRINPEHDDAQ